MTFKLSTEEREYMLNSISDLSKDATGCRVRWNYEAMDDAELQSSWDYFIRELEESNVRDAERAIAAQKRWENHIESLVALGAGNRATAIRWDMDANNIMQGAGEYCYVHGLSYELEERIKLEMAA